MPSDKLLVTAEHFTRLLEKLSELKEQEQWAEVGKMVGENLYNLTGLTTKQLSKLSETELLALLVRQGATIWQPFRQIMLVALLREAGDYATAQYPPSGGRGWYLRSLHILCDAISHENIPDWPHVIPDIHDILASLSTSRLPISTHLVVTRAYERAGLFSHAARQIKLASEQSPENRRILNYAIGLYERLQSKSDATLFVQDLPRREIEAVLTELYRRQEIHTNCHPESS
jgi:hypothetical protein